MKVDVVVLGGGFSGLSFMHHCIQKSISCALIDQKPVLSSASSVPFGLLNYATGRKATPVWRFREGMELTSDWLETIQTYSKDTIHDQNRILRPALTVEMAQDFKQTAEQSVWEEGELRWISKEDIQKEFPWFQHTFGGIVVEKGGSVRGDVLTQAVISYFDQNSVPHFWNTSYVLTPSSAGWTVVTEDRTIEATHIVVATGAEWPEALAKRPYKIHPVKGQLARLKVKQELPFSCSVSGLGYLAQCEKRFVGFGSTYEHIFTHPEPDTAGEMYLRKKLSTLFPDWETYLEIDSLWSGIRASTPNRMPFVGPIPGLENAWSNVGNGSKGLIYSSMTSKYLLAHIFEGEEIPEEIFSLR